MKKLIVCLVMLCATMAYATNDDVVNSQMYVDNLVGNLQTNLPAKTSEKVVTYTTTAGTTGERDIKTELGNESTNTSDNGIPTIGTVNTALDDKQNKLNSLNNVNIVTYTGSTAGTYNGPGIATTTPIYDSTINTFDNGLVNAKTLNDAVIAGVNAEATKITTDPKGALWVFNRTPPKVLPTTANLPANISGTSYCYRNVNPSLKPDNQANCSTTLFNTFSRGDWGVVFPYETGITYDTTCRGTYCGKEIHGISACISRKLSGYVKGTVVSTENTELIAEIESSYNTYKSGGTLEDSNAYCYCKMIQPFVGSIRWVYGGFRPSGECATYCAMTCSAYISYQPEIRRSMFGAAPVPAQSE